MQYKDISPDPEELERYSRQILVPGWGVEGQKKVRGATVFVAGAGGLGSPASIYLAAAGVGRIRLCDWGRVELSNLNRQVLHAEGDLSKAKIRSAVASLRRVNPRVEVTGFLERIGPDTIAGLAAGSDILIDCLDDFETRYVLNEYAVRTGLPLVHAGVCGMAGQITFIRAPETPCLMCLFPEAPPRETFPIVGATAGVVGCLEALEALKFLTGKGNLLMNRLLIWEGDLMKFDEIAVDKDPACPVCGRRSG